MRTSGDVQAYIVHDLMSFLENQQASSLNRAFLFLKYVTQYPSASASLLVWLIQIVARFVVEKKYPIDIAFLCDLIDQMCGCLVLATRNRSRETVNLHNVTLPKSWVLPLAPQFHVLPQKELNLSFLYPRSIGELLERVYVGAADAGTCPYNRPAPSQVLSNCCSTVVVK